MNCKEVNRLGRPSSKIACCFKRPTINRPYHKKPNKIGPNLDIRIKK